jgi:lipid A 4'-phosphatase
LDSLSSLASPIFALLRKLVFPNAPMAVAPSVVLFLIGSFLIGPGLTSNLLLKENWAGRGPTAFGNLPGLPTFSPGGARATPAGGIAL